MEKFLFLTESAWTKSWIEGGEIPIKLASSYLSDSREGILTPDENLVHHGAIPIPSLKQYGCAFDGVKGLKMTNNFSNGKRMPNLYNASYYKEDGLILSFCNHFDKSTAERLGKKACVKVLNIDKTRKIIDEQLGCKGIMKACKYTNDHQRDHFLKSKEDAWQDEYRIFWKAKNSKWVKIENNTAEIVWLAD